MAEVGRLAGALLLVSEGRAYVIGNPKRPPDWAGAGLVAPRDPVDAMTRPFVEVGIAGAVALGPTVLDYPLEGEAAARRLAAQLVIPRNGSVSDRLWRLVTGTDPDTDEAPPRVDATWLAHTPDAVWSIVRDAVLRCT